MKYKLINRKTNEEHLCDKVTIDGFGYYVSDDNANINDWVTNGLQIAQVNVLTVNDPNKNLHKKVIATNNPSINIPQVVDEVKKLAEEFATTINNVSHPVGTIKCLLSYNGFEKGYNKHKETHPFGEGDVKWIFAKTIELSPSIESHTRMISDKEYRNQILDVLYSKVINIWKEQHPITIYYVD